MGSLKELIGVQFLAVAVALLSGPGCVGGEPTGDRGESVRVMLYPLADLPVSRLDSEGNSQFDPSVVIAYIKDCVCPGTWEGSARIVSDSKNGAIVVIQTEKNHSKIMVGLARFGAFAAENVAGQVAERLIDAELSYQQLLLFVADSTSEIARQFFDAQYDSDDQDLQRALGNYVVQCVRCDQADLLGRWSLAAPDRNGATFAILSPEGDLVAEVAFESLAPDGRLDHSRLSEFLTKHKITLSDASEELRAALAKAERENKRVLVQVGGPRCGPCVLLSRYLESQKELLTKEYVHLKLDTRMPKANEVIGPIRKAGGGVPWMAILSSDGQVLVTSDGKQGTIGYPRTDAEKAHFEQMLRTTSQRLSEAEIKTLVNGIGK